MGCEIGITFSDLEIGDEFIVVAQPPEIPKSMVTPSMCGGTVFIKRDLGMAEAELGSSFGKVDFPQGVIVARWPKARPQPCDHQYVDENDTCISCGTDCTCRGTLPGGEAKTADGVVPVGTIVYAPDGSPREDWFVNRGEWWVKHVYRYCVHQNPVSECFAKARRYPAELLRKR